MKTTTTVTTVVLTAEYVELFECFDLANVICEVVDARIANGVYVYTVAPVAPFGVDCSKAREVTAEDFRKVVS